MVRFDSEIDYSDTGGDWTRFYKYKEGRTASKISYKNPKKGNVFITDFYVDPFAKGQGLGTKSWQHFAIDLKKRGVKSVTLTAGQKGWGSRKNKLAAQFWGKMGFTTKSKPSGRPRRFRKVL